jgi:S-DNA-T family DNA segregation ATPase FtsK/SpoIIIE
VAGELRRRTKVIRTLPRDLCPESKITPELAGKRSLGLHPVVLAVDECQRWMEHAEHGKELAEPAEDLVRRGPAVGIQVLGTSAHKNGIRATMFSRRDLGIGWLSGEDDPKIVRTFYVDNPGAEIVVTRARAMREKTGTLSG